MRFGENVSGRNAADEPTWAYCRAVAPARARSSWPSVEESNAAPSGTKRHQGFLLLNTRGSGSAACHAGTRSVSRGPLSLSSRPFLDSESLDSESLSPVTPSLRAINASTLCGPGPRTISHTNRMTYMT